MQKTLSKTLNKVIEDNNIGNINDTLEHVSSEEEISSDKEVVKDLLDDTNTFSSSDNLEDEELAVIIIDDGDVENKDNNTYKLNNESNKVNNISKSNDKVNESAKYSYVNK